MDNNLVIAICALILVLVILPMFLLNGAFKGARKREDGGVADTNPVLFSGGGRKHDDSSDSGGSDGGDGGGGGGE